MKKLLFFVGLVAGLALFTHAANAASITINHYNRTGESVRIANGINCEGGDCAGPYSLRAGQKGTLTNNISATNGAFSLWYGYRTSNYPYYECGAFVAGSKMSWENCYEISYYRRGSNCAMSSSQVDRKNGLFIFDVEQRKW